MFHRLGSINKNQKGFTLLEMLLALLIGAIITGGITATIFQVVIGSARTNNHMIAVRQVQNAGYWVSHDGQMAQDVELGAASGFPLILTWTDWYADEHEVTYDIVDNKLTRIYSVNEGTPSQTLVAQFIDLTNTSCEKDTDSVLILTVTARLGTGSQQASETRVYEVKPRPGS